MTTAPTPEEVRALAAELDGYTPFDPGNWPCGKAADMLRRLQASYQALQTENERLRMELVAEARAAAEQKLRADQLAQQHRMQAQMHAKATQQLAELEARKPLPPARMDELMAEAGYLGASAESRADFINGLRHGEDAHGITGGWS